MGIHDNHGSYCEGELQYAVIMDATDVEKTMQFILETQARLETTAARHDERITRLEASVSRLEASVATVTDLVGRLTQAELRLVERMDLLAARMDQLAESQTHTDHRLEALINVVDKLTRRNGSVQ